jgi:hypothetical protein
MKGSEKGMPLVRTPEPRHDGRTHEDASLVPRRSRDALPTLHAAEPGDVGLVAARLERIGQGSRCCPDRRYRFVDRAILDPGLLDERALDLRSALVAFVVQRTRQRGAGLPFPQGGKLFAVFRQNLISGAEDQLNALM